MMFDCDINPKGSMDKMIAGDYIERTDFEKRDRVNSGSIIKNDDTVSFSTVEEEHQKESTKDFNIDDVFVLKRES